jgi:hypothetical protein
MLSVVLAILKWDPTIRGILFPGIMFLILCGGTYVILATNVGNRLGFLLANAAFWGWMVLMCVIWMMYGIGLKGKDPSWKGIEAVTDPASAQFDKIASLPAVPDQKIKGWKPVIAGSTTYGDSNAALGSFLKKKLTDGGAGMFPATGGERYKSVAMYETGGDQVLKVRPRKIKGEDWYNPKSYRMMGLLHSKHYVVQVIHTYVTDDAGVPVKAADGTFTVDKSTKPIYVVGYRDGGSKRLPAFKIFFFSLILLIVSLISLHKRDKQLMSAMATMKPARA